MNPVVLSSATHTWQTPESFLDLVRAVAPIALDPCTSPENPTGAIRYISPGPVPATGWPLGHLACDGLAESWADWSMGGLCYVNCPYGRALGTWAKKCVEEARLGCEIVLLVPARPDTKWFAHLWAADELLFWRGRLKFRGAKDSAPFPSAVAYWGPRGRRFREAFGPHGQVVRRAA